MKSQGFRRGGGFPCLETLHLCFAGWGFDIDIESKKELATEVFIQKFGEFGKKLRLLRVTELFHRGNLEELASGLVQDGGKLVFVDRIGREIHLDHNGNEIRQTTEEASVPWHSKALSIVSGLKSLIQND